MIGRAQAHTPSKSKQPQGSVSIQRQQSKGDGEKGQISCSEI